MAGSVVIPPGVGTFAAPPVVIALPVVMEFPFISCFCTVLFSAAASFLNKLNENVSERATINTGNAFLTFLISYLAIIYDSEISYPFSVTATVTSHCAE